MHLHNLNHLIYRLNDLIYMNTAFIHLLTFFIYKSNDIIVDPSDKSYSKVCSYLEECNYNRGLKDIQLTSLNDDTFFDIYSSTTIYNLKKKISLLYKESYVYDLDSIMGLLQEYGFFQDQMIYVAINEMIMHKFTIYDKYWLKRLLK